MPLAGYGKRMLNILQIFECSEWQNCKTMYLLALYVCLIVCMQISSVDHTTPQLNYSLYYFLLFLFFSLTFQLCVFTLPNSLLMLSLSFFLSLFHTYLLVTHSFPHPLMFNWHTQADKADNLTQARLIWGNFGKLGNSETF